MTTSTRTRTGRLAAAIVALALVAACTSSGRAGTAPSSAVTASTFQPTTTAPASSPGSTAPVGGVDLRVYFLRGDHVGVAHRRVAPTTAVARAAMTELLAGPSPAESVAGLASTIPVGTSLRGLAVAGGVATVDLSGAFASGGGSLSMTGRLAEVTFTLTQFPTVSGVEFRVDGAPVTVFGGEGIIVDHPATRASFEALAPAILVETPAPMDHLSSPVRISGSADVFEATFQVQLTDGAGRVIASRVVTATAGTGTRGSFDVSVTYALPVGGEGHLTAFDLSAQDGSRLHEVDVPVELAAA